MKKLVAIFLLVSLLGGLCAGCNTMRGFGRDMEKTGERIQETVR